MAPTGDIRPGDYAFITDGIHEANKNHAFVMTNEHVGYGFCYTAYCKRKYH